MLKAGTGRRDVSPQQSVFLWGYPHVDRMSTGIYDPLYATAVCLDDGNQRTIAVSVDVLYVTAAMVAACRQRIAARVGVPPSHVLISATHTHSGPVTAKVLAMSGDPVVPDPDPDYTEWLIEEMAAAAGDAAQRVEEAEVAVTAVQIEGVGGNRLDPGGPHDAEAGLVVVRRPHDRTLIAVQLVYAMHPTILHEDSTLISADFPGYTRRHIETMHPGCRVVYHNGLCGNLSPRYHVEAQTFAEAERLGVRLGTFVTDAIGKLDNAAYRVDAAVGGRQARVALVPRTFPSVAEAEQALHEARAVYERLRREGAAHGPLRTAECVTFGAEEVVTMARAQQSGELGRFQTAYGEAEIQILQVGEAFVAGLPGEWFVEYSLEIKQRSTRPVFPASMANGELQGYITTPGATGYEAGLSMFTPESGERMVEALLALMADAAGEA